MHNSAIAEGRKHSLLLILQTWGSSEVTWPRHNGVAKKGRGCTTASAEGRKNDFRLEMNEALSAIYLPNLWKDFIVNTLLNEALTANEAASVTRVPLKQVHRIIDAGLLAGRVETRKGSRVIIGSGLIGLRLAYLMAETLTPKARKRIVGEAILTNSTKAVNEDALTVTIAPIATEVEAGLEMLEKAKANVTIDPDVMGGVPCISGTRVLVHDVGDFVANGDSTDAILGAYPQLSANAIELAAVYALAYPRRGRPLGKPAWQKETPTKSRTMRLEDLPSAL